MLMMDEEKRRRSLDIFIIRMLAVILGSFMIVESKFRSHSPAISKRKVKFPYILTFSTKNKFLLGC
jgi:hypothetical protein